MRAIFTVSLNRKSQSGLATKEDFLGTLKARGWEDVNLVADEAPDKKEGQKTYSDAVTPLWPQMPETALDEKDFLVYYFNLQDTQTDVIVTHRNKGTIKFRLINPNLEKLLEACELIVRQLARPLDSKDPAYTIRNGRVEILEKNGNHEIVQGRVIVDYLKEVIRKNGKNFWLCITTFIFFVLLTIALVVLKHFGFIPTSIVVGSTERLSTVAITTSIVSGFDFWQTYRQIKTYKIIAWKVSTELNDDNRTLDE